PCIPLPPAWHRGQRERQPVPPSAAASACAAPSQPAHLRRGFIHRALAHTANVASTIAQGLTGVDWAILDSGATGSFGKLGSGTKRKGVPSEKVAGMADGAPVPATEQGEMPLPQLKPNACEGDILPGLQNTLVSVGKMAAAGYATIFDPGDKGVAIYNEKGVCINLIGQRSAPLQGNTLRQASHNIFDLPSAARGICHLHACLGFPTKATWLAVICRCNFVGWPLVSVANVNAHFPECDETPMGHLNQQRQGVRSTKCPVADFEPIDTTLTAGKKAKDVKIHDARDFHGIIYSDQTGRFPYRSRSDNQYVIVMVDLVLVEAMKSKKDTKMQRAYLYLIGRIKKAGVHIEKQVQDNECLQSLKDLVTQTCKYELVPPRCYRRNVAEVAIKAFKNHFIAILAGIDPSFPLFLWDRLLPQVELTLNLLWQFNMLPTISARVHLFSPFDFNRMLLAPLGCPVHIHEPPAKRGSWAPQSKPGWHLSVSQEHYHCHRVCPRDTMTERVSETVFFKTSTSPTPPLRMSTWSSRLPTTSSPPWANAQQMTACATCAASRS
ncbi:LOW QUALITY PROTEIN: hypothetical protein ACHAWF_004421, partial [Thalassiosira exigua]